MTRRDAVRACPRSLSLATSALDIAVTEAAGYVGVAGSGTELLSLRVGRVGLLRAALQSPPQPADESLMALVAAMGEEGGRDRGQTAKTGDVTDRQVP